MDVAALGIQIDSSQIKEATLALKAMPNAASAAERAAQRWGMATDAAGDSAEVFSKRTQKVIRDLEFERAQLTRTTTEQARYSAVRRAGVSASSAQGQAIMASVAALQAQRAATESAAKSTGVMATVTTAAGTGFGALLRFAGPLAIGYLAVSKAMQAWDAGMKAADIGEQAEQVNLTTDALQAYRFVAAQNGIEVQQLDQSMIRLTATMGAAQRGGEEQIKMFEKLGVKLLDSKGNLRATADVLPELSRGLLQVGSQTERNALLTEIFGKSGARMVTMLEAWAGGNEALIAGAKKQGGVLDKDVTDAWDRVKDAMARAGAASDVTLAKLGAPIATFALEAVERLLKSINANLDRLKQEAASLPARAAQNDANELEQQLAAQRGLLAINPNNKMAQASIAALEARRDAAARAALIARQAGMAGDEAAARAGTLPASEPGNPGVSNPVPKGQADAYQKIIAGAQQYVAMKNIETQALGMNAEAAARLKHEQELLGKATEGGITLGAAQTAQLKGLAAAMAEADSKFKTAKFMDDANDAARKFIAAQEVERQTLFMSAEAAMAYRIEQELLTKAANDNITVTAAQAAELHALALAQAAAGEKTRQTKELVDLGKETFRGFFADINQGLREGANVWDIFGTAATNALNRISDKLLQMATDKLFEAAFGGASGGGGLGGGILNFLGLGGGGGAGAYGPTISGGFGDALTESAVLVAAKGAAFSGGNVIPFASGGVVGGPTNFGMSGGRMGLMGEAGPEGVLPLRRGRGGRLGVEASGAGGQPIVIQVVGDTGLVRVVARDEAVSVVQTAAPGIEARAVNKARDQVVPTVERHRQERGGDYRG